jgi:hypothetical protein
LKAYRRDPARGRNCSNRATGLPQSVSKHCEIPSESYEKLFRKDLDAIEGGGAERFVLMRLKKSLGLCRDERRFEKPRTSSYGNRAAMGTKKSSNYAEDRQRLKRLLKSIRTLSDGSGDSARDTVWRKAIAVSRRKIGILY